MIITDKERVIVLDAAVKELIEENKRLTTDNARMQKEIDSLYQCTAKSHVWHPLDEHHFGESCVCGERKLGVNTPWSRNYAVTSRIQEDES